MHSALASMKFRVSKPIDRSDVKSFMRNLLFLLSMAMTITAHAEVFKCVKDGRVSYSDNPCDGAVIIGNSKSMRSSEGLDAGLSAFENGNYALAESLHSRRTTTHSTVRCTTIPRSAGEF